MKHLIILLSLISTILITGCGGGNMGGNAAENPQEDQQIEEPQMMADQGMNVGQPAFDQNMDQNWDQNENQLNDAGMDNLENIDNTQENNNEQAVDEQNDAGNLDTDEDDTENNDTKEEAVDKDTNGTTDTEVKNTETDNKDDLVTATGTLILANNNNTEENAVITFDAFATDLDPAKEREKITRVASASTSGGENIPDLAAELGK